MLTDHPAISLWVTWPLKMKATACLILMICLVTVSMIFTPKATSQSASRPSTASALDSHTLLYLSFDSTLNGAQGEVPTQASGYSFQLGVAGTGLALPAGNQPFYSAAGNIGAKEGTVECWIKPDWNGNDGQNHYLLQYGVGGGMLIGKDGANNLRLILNRFGAAGGNEVGTATNISSWKANEWHYVAFTWSDSGKSLKLYVDGILRSQSTINAPLPAISSTTFQLGGDGTGSYVNAVIDELRISDIERTAQEVTARKSGLAVTSQAQAADTKQLPSLKWEYQVIRVEFLNVSAFQAQTQIESTLNKLGAEGWELVLFQPLSPATDTPTNPSLTNFRGCYFLKRAKRP